MKPDQIAVQLKQLRESKGWTQAELARRAGVSQQAVSHLEQPKYRRHSMPTLRRLAKKMGAEVEVRLVSKANGT